MFYNNIFKEIFPKNNSLHINFITILLLLVPISLVTGPALPDIFISIIGLYFLIISLVNREFRYYKNKFTYIFGLFCIYIIFRGLFSEDPYQQLIMLDGPFFYFRYLFFILGTWYLIEHNVKIIKYFFIILLFILLFFIFDGFFQWIFGRKLFGFTHTVARIPGIFKDEEILGHFLSHVVPLCFALMVFLYEYNKKTVFFFMAFLIISEVFIFITHDRSALLKIVQFTLLLIFLSNHFKFLRIISFVISIVLIGLILSYSTKSQTRYSNTVIEVTATKVPYMPWTPVHEQHFALAYSFFEKNPLFGKGPQYFKTTCIKNPELVGCTSHPHNYYFQTIGELGIIGISFLLIGFIFLAIKLIKQFYMIWFKNSKIATIPDHLLALYSLVFIFLWPIIPNGSFYNNWLNSMLFLPIPFILYFQNKLKIN